MKKSFVCCLILMMLFSLTACRLNYMDSDEIQAFFSNLAEDLGSSQITDDDTGTMELRSTYDASDIDKI